MYRHENSWPELHMNFEGIWDIGVYGCLKETSSHSMPSPLDRKKSVIFLRFEFEISATIPKSMSTKNYYLFFPSI